MSFSIFVNAQNDSSGSDATPKEIIFPIAELDNCSNKKECRDYCNNPSHMDVCIQFAKEHGLMNDAEAERAYKFKDALQKGSGPGGCNSEDSCKTYCSDVSHIEDCIAFAKQMGITEDVHISQAEKVSVYLRSGGTMPGNCTSKESCQQYCSDFSHGEECIAFAEKSGLAMTEGSHEIAPGQFRKFLELAKKGQTPGGCGSKDGCEQYCQDTSHFQECVDFAKEAGFINHEQSEMIKKSGGKGPGNCNSKETCQRYCDDESHREECFNFAKDRGMIDEGQLRHMKNGLVWLKQGLEQAPPEVAACLTSLLGSNIIEDIQAGKLSPGPEIAVKTKECFEKFNHSQRSLLVVAGEIPKEVLACIHEKIGDSFDKIQSGEQELTPETADTIRICFQSVHFNEGSGNNEPARFLKSAPTQVQACLKEKVGNEFEKLKEGSEHFNFELKGKIRECIEQFRPQAQKGFNESENDGQAARERAKNHFEGMSKELIECIKNLVGQEAFNKVASGEKSFSELREEVAMCMEMIRDVPSTDQHTESIENMRDTMQK